MLTRIIATTTGLATIASAQDALNNVLEQKIVQDLQQIIQNYDFSDVISTAMTEE